MWYGVSIFMRGASAARPEEQQLWEESVVLFDADSEQDASDLAVQYGREAEHSYESATGELICWTFESVGSVHQLLCDKLESGSEVFSHFISSRLAREMLNDTVGW